MKLKRKITALLVSLCLFGTALPVAFSCETANAYTQTYNTGTRDTVAKSLSDAAKDYYQGIYSYSSLSKENSTNLKNSLYTLMSSTMTNSVSYSSLTSYWKYTDAENGQAGTVLFYSDEYGTNYNREHVWPKSRASFYQRNGGSDLHHLRPTDVKVNSTRGNMTMGELNHQGTPVIYNGKTVGWYDTAADKFEPLDNVKGDVARIYLYVYVRWQQPNLYENVPQSGLPAFDSDDSKNDGRAVIESLDTLLKWMQEDPVDTWEMSRNDLVEDIQGNRNVFIDYPEYAWKLFGRSVPANLVVPSGNVSSTSPAPTVKPSASVTPTPTVKPSASVTPAPTVKPSTSVTPAPTVSPSATSQPNVFTKVTSVQHNGNYVIAASPYDGTMCGLGNSLSSGKISASTINVSKTNTVQVPTQSLVWTLKYDSSKNCYALYNAACKKYLSISKNSDNAFVLSKSPSYIFKVERDTTSADGGMCIYAPVKYNRCISIYSKTLFASKKKTSAKPIYLFQN